MIPKTWLEYQQYVDVHVEMTQKFIMPTVRSFYFVEKDFESWDPKFHGPRNYHQSFYVDDIIEECVTKNHYPFAMF